MTKLKNTKKGMAKKALSISLVAAMLATSNVPVWAAEDLFSDGSAAVEAPAVEEPADVVVEEETPIASTFAATEGYTVNTNMELKAKDWNTYLKLDKKDGVSDAAKFEILDKNSLPVNATKVEVYGGLGMIAAPTVTDGDVAAALATVKVGKESYLASNQVTAKVYVGESVVCEFSAAVNAVDISEWNISLDSSSATYNGKIQTPTATVTKDDLTADVIVRFKDAKEAKNADTYECYAEGIGAYTGITKNSATYTINAVAPTAKNLSVVLSGDITYNGNGAGKALPEVEVKDLTTGEVLPKELYTVAVTKKDVGSYTRSNVTVELKSSETIDGVTVKNNFEAEVVPSACITGTYKISVLNLNNLSQKYDITVNARENANAGWNDLIIVDKSTGKTVKATDVLPTGELNLKSVLNSETKVATATITPRTTTNNITGSYSFDYSVVANVMSKEDVSLPKGTVIGTKTLNSKQTLAEVNDDIYNVLGKIYYTGSAIEPLKDVFSNMVLTTTAGTTDQTLVLGQDYDLVYTENTQSADTEKSSIKIVFKGQYTGTIEYPFQIKKAEVTVKAVSVPYVAGQNSYNLAVEVTDNVSKTAVPEKAYTVTTTKKAYKIGEYAEGNVVFNDKNYKITNASAETNDAGFMYVDNLKSKVSAKTLEDCIGTVEGEYVYTGETVNPKVVVKDGDVVLTENKDYKIVSKVGVNAGPAYVIVEGMGNYSGQLTIDYTIKKANLADAIVKSDNNKDNKNYDVGYTGAPVAPNTKGGIFIGEEPLTEYNSINNTGDYIITYDENAVDVGTYSFTITAAPSSTKVEGEFKGTYKVVPSKMSGSFATQIGLSPISASKPLDVSVTGASYTGSEIKIDSFKTKYVVIDKDKNILTEGKDYRLEYTNNVDAGLATVKAYGLGNHAYVDENGVEIPMATMSFYIGGKVITSKMVRKINNAEYAGGLSVEPEVVVMYDDDTRLVQGRDYIVTTNVTAIKKGYTDKNITIVGKGAYTTTDENNGKLVTDGSLKWDVTKKDLQNTTVTVSGKTVTVMNGTVVVPSSEYDVVFSEDGTKVTVTAKASSQFYTGSKETAVDGEPVGQMVINEVKVVGNKATVILAGEADNATGYDYVISTVDNYTDGRLANGVNKNQLTTETSYQYLQKGTYYAYGHAWKRDENGNKVFGPWSNIYQFTVGATTPNQPSITKVEKSSNGKHLRITWTKSANAIGYDVVMGTKLQKVNGELRPVEYGKAVKKVTNGNTVSVIFYNIPKGTYYVGLHAYNRSSLEGTKVFSPWSNSVKVTF